jgi:type IV/VI secretion system ImpK/VasF family protein
VSRRGYPELADLTYPVFAHVLEVVDRARRGQHADFPSTADRVRDLIREAEERAARTPYRREFPDVKRALAYWADEVLINSEWAHRQTWEVNSLESEYYGEKLRAVRFYEHSRRARDSKDTGPLEQFLLAMALGFRGEYRRDPDALAREAKSYLRRYFERNQAEPLGGGTAGGPLRALPGTTVLLTVCALVAATALLTLVCFLCTHSPGRFRV